MFGAVEGRYVGEKWREDSCREDSGDRISPPSFKANRGRDRRPWSDSPSGHLRLADVLEVSGRGELNLARVICTRTNAATPVAGRPRPCDIEHWETPTPEAKHPVTGPRMEAQSGGRHPERRPRVMLPSDVDDASSSRRDE